MARCLAFPPPVYMQNGVRGVALLELLKARREEKAVSEKKRKKEKKKRKKEEEEEEELEEGEIREIKYFTHKHKNIEKKDVCQMNTNGVYEIQLLERSSLTEELDLPIFDSLYDSSDSTRNIKRKHHCCARTSFLVQEKSELAPNFVSSATSLYCVESQYTELIVNWMPPPIQIEHYEFDDQEWLFEMKLLRSNMVSGTSYICNDDSPHERSSLTLYPCAQYLPHQGICSLPYTTLF